MTPLAMRLRLVGDVRHAALVEVAAALDRAASLEGGAAELGVTSRTLRRWQAEDAGVAAVLEAWRLGRVAKIDGWCDRA